MDSPNCPRDTGVNVILVARLLLSSVAQMLYMCEHSVFMGTMCVHSQPLFHIHIRTLIRSTQKDNITATSNNISGSWKCLRKANVQRRKYLTGGTFRNVEGILARPPWGRLSLQTGLFLSAVVILVAFRMLHLAVSFCPP
jgi:hypothetical protein